MKWLLLDEKSYSEMNKSDNETMKVVTENCA